MTADSHFTVAVDRQGAVCTRSVSSDLDLTLLSVSRSRRPAWDPTIEQLELDLSPLRLADCCGARALEAVTRAVPR